jgi:hypothetical protein
MKRLKQWTSAMRAALPDRWTVIDVSGAGLLGGGVWALCGAPWACVLWGSMLLTLSCLRAWRAGGAR